MSTSKSSIVFNVATCLCAAVTGYIVVACVTSSTISLNLRLHILLASVGSFFFMPVSFMVLATKKSCMLKRKLHVWLATLGIICVIASMIPAFLIKEPAFNPNLRPSDKGNSESSLMLNEEKSNMLSNQSSTIAAGVPTEAPLRHYRTPHGQYGIASHTLGAFVSIMGIPLTYMSQRFSPKVNSVIEHIHKIIGVVTYILWAVSNYFTKNTKPIKKEHAFTSVMDPECWGWFFVFFMFFPLVILYNPWMHPKWRNKASMCWYGRYLNIHPLSLNPQISVDCEDDPCKKTDGTMTPQNPDHQPIVRRLLD
eukprot:GDKJ01058314.1.p1 GENE.GDKJ01058314.1~~GDKJ01058314.1.p1  ORF type:complete len:309 (+),score=23.47 GDKJ01058314.1:47-973(+)